ncbi:Glycerophosphodiester phosphodiesterase GDPD2 [Nosema granulosis]|uniref:Glycerophosphodiester phosphodiesterase GDPD2 n=1 Tax=Nosema granulosis TaxID=83296 RepID=A0A9P6GZP2_9MICR|nr:Glycerophosphodiester phosphodiesterase GDPD2 [Nosema granulosis]
MFAIKKALTKFCLYVLKCPKDSYITFDVYSKGKRCGEGDFLMIDGVDKIQGFCNDKAFTIDLPDGVSEIREIKIDSETKLVLISAQEFTNFFTNNFEGSSIMGHRGSGMQNIYKTMKSEELAYYENSVSSFNDAWTNGARWVELDVQVTKNLVPVIFHDFVLDKDGERTPIAELTDTEFLDFFSKKKTKDNMVCTLESIFSRIDEKMAINIEIKYPTNEECLINNIEKSISINEYVDRILEVIKNQTRRFCFSSFNPLVVLYLRMRLPKALIMFIIHHEIVYHKADPSKSIERVVSFCSTACLDGLVMDYEFIKNRPEDVKKMCTENNLKVFIYGDEVSQNDTVKKLLAIGIDGVITDDIKSVILVK